MKKLIFNLMNNSFLFSLIITRVLNYKNYFFKSYEKVLLEKREFDIWDVEELSQEMKPYYADTTPNSSYYGITYILKKYANVNKIIGVNTEHGLYFGDYIEKESIGKSVNLNITISNRRIDILNKSHIKNCISIGPYIHYASDYYSSKKLKELKRKLGKVLLAFPPHSTRTVDAVYNKDRFIEYLMGQQKNYDTIMVCFFYKDIQSKSFVEYRNKGFMIVTAGHMFDANFLSRQKAIISLADHTVSVTIGTHIGYCIFLGKSHEIIKLSTNNIKENKHINIDKKIDNQNISNIRRPLFEQDEDLMLSAFLNSSNCSENIKKTIVEDYWGINCIRSKEELNRILLGVK